MARKRKKVYKEVIKRQEAYQEELRRRRFLNICGYSAIVALTLILILIIAGGYLPVPKVLRQIGLKNEGQGLWIDCNEAQNRNKEYCLKRVRKPKKSDWKDIRRGSGGKKPAFSLN